MTHHATSLLITVGVDTHVNTHTDVHAQDQFQETRRAPACGQRAPGLKNCTNIAKDHLQYLVSPTSLILML